MRNVSLQLHISEDEVIEGIRTIFQPPVFKAVRPKLKFSITCTLCESVFWMFDTLMWWGVSDETLINSINSLCVNLHIFAEDVCNVMVLTQGVSVVNNLIQGFWGH